MVVKNSFKVAYSKTRERDIWQDFQQGDKDAFNRLYDMYVALLLQYAMKFSADAPFIEDCVQETFIDIWMSREKITVPDSVKGYLLKSVRNKIITRQKQTKNYFESLNFLKKKEEIFFSFSIETELINLEADQQRTLNVKTVMEKLSDIQREVLYHKFFNNLSVPEICEIMVLPKKSIYNALAKGLAKMRTILA